MIRLLIIEDEDLAVKRLKRLLSTLDFAIDIKEEFGSVVESVAFLEKHQSDIDLIFMDIHLSDGNSFEIFESLKIVKPIIFVTAYNQYALQAFKQLSLDYLLKPIQQEDLSNALEKYGQIYGDRSESVRWSYDQLQALLQGDRNEYKKRFLVTIGDRYRYIAVEDIALFYADNKACFVISKEGKRYYVNYTLERLVPLLKESDFYRVSRKVIVHIDAVHELVPFSKSKLLVKTHQDPGFEIFVSGEKVRKFKEWLNA